MKLAYRAYDKTGKAVRDTVDAADADAAAEQLRRRGLFVTEIAPRAEESVENHRLCQIKSRGRHLKNLAIFCRQLSVLVSTGTPIVQALAALERQIKDPHFAVVLGDIRRRVEEGASLSAAMEAHCEQFDPITRSLIAAGESGGQLDAMLDRLASLTRQRLHVRNSLVGALVYPCLLIVVAIGVLTLMLGFVLPRFVGLFDTLDTALPPSTEALIWVSDMLRTYWWMALLGVGAVVIGLRFWVGTPDGKRAVDTVAVRLPGLAKITRNFATARIARVLGLLLDSKVPLLESLRLTLQATSNVHYAALITRAEDVVTKGEAISLAFADPALIDPSIHEALRNGEENGRIGSVLMQVAEFLDEDNEVIIRSVTSIVEPIILIALGILVGFVAISMFLPLFDLTAATAQGG